MNKILLLLGLSLLFGMKGEAREFTVVDSVLTVSAEVETLPPYSFMERDDIREVRFEAPSKLKTIGEGAFRECLNLRKVELPSGVKDLKAHVFAYCEKLESVNIPDGVVHIGNNCFSRCLSLRTAVLPRSVTELESYAFSDCRSLTRAVLPANPKLLGELIFSGCESLVEIHEGSKTPPPFDCNSYLFEPDEEGMYKRCRLVVPAGSRKAYAGAPGWKLFKNLSR